MAKIKEIQFEKYNPDNKQERELEYDSWQEYIENIQKIDGMRHRQHPSLPRMVSVMNFKVWNDSLSLEFVHPVTRHRIVHEAHLIEGLN